MIGKLFTRGTKEKAAPRAHDAFFLTQPAPEMSKLDMGRRLVNAMARSFQKELLPTDVYDEAGVKFAMDSSIQTAKAAASSQGFLPVHQVEWYASQGFIGWQMCAILSQQWLIGKVCSMPGQDAVRHGWEYSVNDGTKIDAKVMDMMRKADEKFQVQKNCEEHIRFAGIFGVRHTLFLIDEVDYEKPFNPDGIKAGNYKGMAQIDPYWLSPELDTAAATDPSNRNFYEPTWWRVSGGNLKGRRIHRSHFIISRNMSDVPDLLKPSYFYGGIPTTQKIYERVYAAERTANEAPLLAMTKRLYTLQTDITKAMADPEKFKAKLEEWLAMINNMGCKVIGLDETMGQIDTNLTGLDETIMTQYQLVSSAGEVPSTKLLGTAPKGFNATGEYDDKSYSQRLETIQKNELSPLVERHALCAMRSEIAPKCKIKPFSVGVEWNPTNPTTAKEKAEINKSNSETAKNYVDMGAIIGEEARERLIADPDSGFNGLPPEMPDLPEDPGEEPDGDGKEQV